MSMILLALLLLPFQKREHLEEAAAPDNRLHNGRDRMPQWKRTCFSVCAFATVLCPWRGCCLGLALVLGVMIVFYWSTVSYIIKKIRGFGRISFVKLFQDVAPGLIFEIDQSFAFVVIHDDANGSDMKNIIMVTFFWFLLSVAPSRAYFWALCKDVLRSSRRFLENVISRGFNPCLNALRGYILPLFCGFLEAVISFPGFNSCVDELVAYILALAIFFIPVLGAVMFSHGARCLVLNMLKSLVKQGLVRLLVGSGKNYDDAKTLVDMHVTNTV